MNSLAKAMGYLLAAVMLAAFALPASASNKSISLAVPLTTEAGPGTVEVLATITNTGNSTANSFQIDFNESETGIEVIGATIVGGSVGVKVGALTSGFEYGYVFTNQSPLAKNKSVTIKLSVNLDAGCEDASIDWFAYAWTGAPSSPSQSFTLAPGDYSTSSASSCSLLFGTQPADAFVGNTITGGVLSSESVNFVTVELLQNGVLATGATGQVTVSMTSDCATASPTDIENGVATLTSLLATTVSPACVLIAKAPGYGSVESSPFKVLFSAGDLACKGVAQDRGASLRRLDNAIGDNEIVGGCTGIPHSLEFDGQTVTFLADYSVLPSSDGVAVEPAFAFELPWQSEYISVPAHLPIPYMENYNPPALGGTFAQAVPLSTHKFAVGDTRFLLDFCPGQPVYDDGVFTGLTLPDDFDADEDGYNDLSTLPGFQYGCVIERKVEVVKDGALCPTGEDETGPNAICVKVTETGYLRGDWTSTRTLR